MMIFLLIFLLFAVPAQGATLFSENWDAYTSNWSWSCDLNPYGDGSNGYCPDDVFGIPTWPSCNSDISSNYCQAGEPSIEITDQARRGSTGRGFRLWVYPDSSGTCCENGLTTSTTAWTGVTNFYLRWYMRTNFVTQSSYKKLFRIKDQGGSQRFILDLYNLGHGVTLSLWSSANSFGQPYENRSWTLSTLGANTWACFEIFVDQTNRQWTLWVNGVQQGSPISIPASSYTIRGIMVGGNQVGQGGSTTHIVDYDDIVVSTT